MNPFWILLGAGSTIAACWGAGGLACRALSVTPVPRSIAYGVGAAALSTLLFAISALQWLKFPVLLAMLGFAIVKGLPPVWKRPGFNLWLLAFAPFAIWYLVYALAPEASADGNYYHLTYPRQYLEHGGFFRIVYNMYASLPQGLEMLFLPAIAMGGFSAAALVHLSFLFALASALAAQAKAGWLAALLVFASPVMGMDASTAYNDVALACCTFLAFIAAQAITPAAPRNALLAGILSGFCFAIKYTGVLAIPLVLGFTAFRTRSLRWTLLTAAAALAVAAPWLIRNAAWTGNPLAPFFNRVFPNPYVRVDMEDKYLASMRHYGGHSINAETPLELTVRGEKLQGLLGPVFLLTPLAFLGSWRLAGVGLYFALPWTLNLGTRFLIPSLPFFALALSLLLVRIPWGAYLAAAAHAASAWPPVVALYCSPYAWRVHDFPWRASLRIEPEREFLARRDPVGYPIVEMINANTQPGAIVYTALPLPDAYCQRTVLLDYTSADSNNVRDAIRAGPAQAIAAFKSAGVTYVLIHRDEPAARPIAQDPRGWGLEPGPESGPTRLYKVI